MERCTNPDCFVCLDIQQNGSCPTLVKVEEPDQDVLWEELATVVRDASLHSFMSSIAIDKVKKLYTITRK